jgi:methylmalonyl-CoA mutase N-terminal domain/subunit
VLAVPTKKKKESGLDEAKARWERAFADEPVQEIDFTTVSLEPLNPLYTEQDAAGIDYLRDLGFPGDYPFTRGVYPTMYRGRFWTMRQFSGFGTPRDTNRRYHYLLDHGQTGISVAFDMPTIMGYDSDHPRAEGEVGRCGVAIDSLRDMEILFDGIDPAKITTSMTINAPASILLAFYLCAGEKKGARFDQMGGTIQNDILKEYIAQKSWIFPPEPSMRIITDILAFCAERVPKWNTISISGYHIREAGSTAVQELAFTLADGFAYVEAGIAAGLDVDVFAPRLSFFFNAHLDFFEEIAKYRAARRIWAKRMRGKYGAKDPRSWLCRFHTQTAGCSLTAQQPENNIVRTAFQALSAVLGGTQSLHTDAYDEALAVPTEVAALLALRQQQVIAEETGVANTVDPLGGSWFVEALTNETERAVWQYLDEIDARGGMVKAVEAGYPQREIADAAYRYQRELEAGERIVVGVNRYADAGERLSVPVLQVPEGSLARQLARLERTRRERDAEAVAAALAGLRDAAARPESSETNLMPHFIRCARAYATLGEQCAVLREVFGEYREPAAI